MNITRSIRSLFLVFVLAVLVVGALAIYPKGSISFGTSSNDWTISYFGWPCEVLSTTNHTYRYINYSSDQRETKEIRDPTKYGVRWANVGWLFSGAIAASSILVFYFLPWRSK
jgi:hypothetical protein